LFGKIKEYGLKFKNVVKVAIDNKEEFRMLFRPKEHIFWFSSHGDDLGKLLENLKHN